MAEAEDRLNDRFLARWRGAPPSGDTREALATALHAALARSRTEWPDVPLDEERFVGWLADRAAIDRAPDVAVERLRAPELYIACACAQGVPEALAGFERRYIRRVGDWIASLRPTPQLVDDTQQLLREKLFIGGPDGAAKIAQYGGQGSLDGWVRVAAVRTALNLIDAANPRARADEDEAVAELVDDDPELDYIKGRYRDDFLAAFRDALVQLPARDRTLLRFHHQDRLTPARVGAIYGVHRTTAAHWIADAQHRLLDVTRALLMSRLQVSPSECDSLIELVKSKLQVSMTALFRTAQ